MPKVPVDYSNTIIYKLINYDCPENVYVGSTTNRTRRKQLHKCCVTNPNNKAYNSKVYKMIRENGGWESWHMIDIKAFPCVNKRETEAEEDRIMQELKANMNSNKSYCTAEYKKQYEKDYREENKERHKMWREANKDIRAEKGKAHYQANQEKYKQYRDENKVKNK
jgi:hypothetical protein